MIKVYSTSFKAKPPVRYAAVPIRRSVVELEAKTLTHLHLISSAMMPKNPKVAAVYKGYLLKLRYFDAAVYMKIMHINGLVRAIKEVAVPFYTGLDEYCEPTGIAALDGDRPLTTFIMRSGIVYYLRSDIWKPCSAVAVAVIGQDHKCANRLGAELMPQLVESKKPDYENGVLMGMMLENKDLVDYVTRQCTDPRRRERLISISKRQDCEFNLGRWPPLLARSLLRKTLGAHRQDHYA